MIDPRLASPSQPLRGVSDAPRIAAVTGEANEQIQDLLWTFATDLRRRGVRVAGVVERQMCGGRRTSDSVRLVNLLTGESSAVFQDLGAESSACRMDPSGILHACVGVLRSFDADMDLVVLSKFGKLEAARSGLTDAFAAAVGADVPILTAVAPTVRAEWEAFAAPLAVVLRPERAALDAWWQAISARTGAAANATRSPSQGDGFVGSMIGRLCV